MRAEGQPLGESADGLDSGALAVGRAVVVDQAGLDNIVADGSVIAASENVVVAQQVLTAAFVLQQGTQCAGAAVDDAVAVSVEVVVVSARAAQKHRRLEFNLMTGWVAGYAGGVEQNGSFGPGREKSCRRYDVGDASGGDGCGRGISHRAGGEGTLIVLAAGQTQGAEAAACAGGGVGQSEVDRGCSTGLGKDSGEGHGATCSQSHILGRERLEETGRQCESGGSFNRRIGLECCGHSDVNLIGGQIAG